MSVGIESKLIAVHWQWMADAPNCIHGRYKLDACMRFIRQLVSSHERDRTRGVCAVAGCD